MRTSHFLFAACVLLLGNSPSRLSPLRTKSLREKCSCSNLSSTDRVLIGCKAQYMLHKAVMKVPSFQVETGSWKAGTDSRP